MGLDVGAYKEWKKIKVTYHRPKFKKEIPLVKEDLEQLYSLFYTLPNDFLEYILWFTGSNQVQDYSESEVKHFIKKGKELREIIIQHIPQNQLSKYHFLLEELKDSALLKVYKNKEFVLVSFNSLEEYEREIWDYDDFVDVKYPNGEILDAFSKTKKLFNIDLYPYIINTEAVEEINDEKVNHNISDAIITAKKAIEANKENIILLNRKTPVIDEATSKISWQDTPIYLNDLLNECIRIWELGAKLEYC